MPTPKHFASLELRALSEIDTDPGNWTISPTETMGYGGDEAMYFVHGKSAMRCIDGTLGLLGRRRGDVRSILDFPCGHGRVLRYLKRHFPEADIVASDIDEPGVKFCAETLGAIPHLSSDNIESIDFGRTFDLIWVGSLLTHVDAPDWYRFLDLWQRSLNPGGLLIFTYASSYVRWLADNGEFENVNQQALARAKKAYDESGFGYLPYREGDAYGQTFVSEAWVAQFLARWPRLRSIVHFERGWGARQNVVALTLDKVASLIAAG